MGSDGNAVILHCWTKNAYLICIDWKLRTLACIFLHPSISTGQDSKKWLNLEKWPQYLDLEWILDQLVLHAPPIGMNHAGNPFSSKTVLGRCPKVRTSHPWRSSCVLATQQATHFLFVHGFLFSISFASPTTVWKATCWTVTHFVKIKLRSKIKVLGAIYRHYFTSRYHLIFTIQ